MACPSLSDVPAIQLGTRDAHGLYQQYGFEAPADTTGIMFAKLAGTPWKQLDLVRE